MLRFSFIPAVKGGVFQVFCIAVCFVFTSPLFSVYQVTFHMIAKPTNRKALKEGLSA